MVLLVFTDIPEITLSIEMLYTAMVYNILHECSSFVLLF